MAITSNWKKHLGWAEGGETKWQYAWGFLFAYLGFSWLWLMLVDAPWDDDVPTRFINTQMAFVQPENLVSLWNRPLFVWIFALPSQLGKHSVSLLMPIFAAIAAWSLWRSQLAALKSWAWLLVPLLLFQPFFFGTSRVALTEPLAVAIFCLGFRFQTEKKWTLMALVLGLLPLARLELSPVLIIWALPLLREKRWRDLAILTLPFLLWNVLAGIITGDFLYVLTQTFGADNALNRYGHTPFAHYFERFAYVIGPVCFPLLLAGLLGRLLRKESTLMLEGQFILILAIYVLFSWKLNMGNAAGFLRNLVPLAPFVAILSGHGWKMLASEAKGGLMEQISSKAWAILGMLLGLVLLASVYAHPLKLHHIVEPDFDPTLLAFALFVPIAFLLVTFFGKKMALATFLLGFGAMSYTIYSEPPGASDIAERRAIGIIAEAYLEGGMESQPTYVNHRWFNWKTGIRPDASNMNILTQANLNAAPIGSIVIWDMHFSSRLAGDVAPGYFQIHPEFVELMRIGLPDRKECVVLYQKAENDPKVIEAISSQFAARNPNHLPSLTGRIFQLFWNQRYPECIMEADKLLARAPNEPDLHFVRGYALLGLDQAAEAELAFQNCLSLWPEFPTAWYNLGLARNQLNKAEAALAAFDEAIAQDGDFSEAYFSRGSMLAKLGRIQDALPDFSAAVRLQPNNPGFLFSRAVSYSMLNQPQPALADIQKVTTLQPGNMEAWFVRGRIEFQIGKEADGCKSMQTALAGGLDKAAELIQKHCGISGLTQ